MQGKSKQYFSHCATPTGNRLLQTTVDMKVKQNHWTRRNTQQRLQYKG